MLTKGLKAAFLGLATAFAAFPAMSADVTVKHFQGETAVPERPAKIVVFDLVSLDTLNTLGVKGVVGVPSGIKPAYLADYAGGKVAEVGTLFEPNYEAVAAAEPDLIIVGGRSSAKYKDLAKIAPTIDMSVDNTNFLASAENNVEKLGKLFGKETEASALLDKLKASTTSLKEKAPSAGKTLFLLTTGGRMSAFGPGSRFGLIYSDFGFAPVTLPARAEEERAQDGKPSAEGARPANHGQPMSFEFILEANPDTIVVLDRDAAIGQASGEAASKLLDNEIVRQTKAARKGKIIYIDSVLWYIAPGGLTSMQKTVDELATALNKG